MGTTRRRTIAGISTCVVAGLVALLLLGSGGTESSRALGSDRSTPLVDAPEITTTAPPQAPAPEAPAAPEARPAEVVEAEVAPPAPPAPPAEVPIPRNPVPIADSTGPAISNLRFMGCVFAADITDPAGVAVATLAWSGVPDPDFPGEWITPPGTFRMHKAADGDRYQGSRPRPYRGQVFTVTAVDRTLVGNRSQASVTVNFDGYPC
ncbi:MAG: hypothetical protein WD598_15270 [Acidimicrobiia bacterium]